MSFICHGLQDQEAEAAVGRSSTHTEEPSVLTTFYMSLEHEYSQDFSGNNATIFDTSSYSEGYMSATSLYWFSYIVSVGHMMLQLFDFLFDIYLSMRYHYEGNINWCAWTVVILVGSTIVIQACSASKLRTIYNKLRTSPSGRIYFSAYILLHIVQLPVLANRIHLLVDNSIEVQRFIAILLMIESYLEAAPQLLLQIYVECRKQLIQLHHQRELDLHNSPANNTGNVTMTPQPLPNPLKAVFSIKNLQYASVATSWLTMTVAGVSFTETATNRKKQTVMERLFLFFGKFFTLGARLLTLAVFGSVYTRWILLLLAAQYTCMAATVLPLKMVMDSNCTKMSYVCKNMTLGLFIGLLCCIDPHISCIVPFYENIGKAKMSPVMVGLIFNIGTAIGWFCSDGRTQYNIWYRIPAIVFIFLGTSIGHLCLLAYHYPRRVRRECHTVGSYFREHCRRTCGCMCCCRASAQAAAVSNTVAQLKRGQQIQMVPSPAPLSKETSKI